jgi:SNF2 family DNA or RNA helicase
MENPPFRYVKAPYDHQRNEFESTREFQYFAHFWEMGLGKSKIVIDTIQWLFLQGKIDSVIITAEKGYYLNWMIDEFPKHFPDDLPIRLRAYSAATNTKERKLIEEIKFPKEGFLDVILINIESLSGTAIAGSLYAEEFVERHESTMMVIDESTTIKNPQAARTKQAIRVGKRCAYRRILTGTPITQSPIDLFSQCEFLKKGLLGFASYTSFRNFYSVTQPLYMGSRVIHQVVGYRELDDLSRRLQPFSSRLLKADCLTLPEKIYSSVYVEPTRQQRVYMDALKNEAMIMAGQGLVTVQNALTLLTKALQIAGGHIKDDEGNVSRVTSDKPQTLSRLIESIPDDKKIIVWGYFHEDMQIIQEALKEICPVFEMSGRVTGSEERSAAVDQFRKHDGKCVFLGSPRVAGKSLTLNEAEYVVYYSNGFNLEHRLQSEDRNHRIGQNSAVNYYDLICLDTPDVKVVHALKNKEMISKEVLNNVSSYFDYQVAL